MATLSIAQEMLNYFIQLNEAEKKSVLEMLKTFVSTRTTEMKPQTLQQYNEELEQADAEIEAGDYITHAEVMKRYLNK